MNTLPHIVFAGAGPGDPGLITIKLVECLKTSDCILVDRLVNPAILTTYVDPAAEVIFVGKQAYQDESFHQSDINALLIQKALAGKRTLRLKGGDVAIYSNVIDEIHAISAHGITYEIIPGITAASGAVASMGISLTGRGIAPGVQIHTMATHEVVDLDDFKYWAQSKDTLVFYMSIGPLKKLIKDLVFHGASPERPLAIVEEATTPTQRTSIFTIGSFMNQTELLEFRSPALVIIGEIIHEIKIQPQYHSMPGITFEPINSKTKKHTIHVI